MVVFFGVCQAVAAVVLLGAGRWGRQNFTSIVPDSLSGAARQRRIRSVLRGAAICQVLGVLTLACAVLLLTLVR